MPYNGNSHKILDQHHVEYFLFEGDHELTLNAVSTFVQEVGFKKWLQDGFLL